MNTKTKNFQHLLSRQYATADKLRARWDLFALSVPKIDIHQTGLDRLRLKGREDILEVGCGDGHVLLNLRRQGHAGRLVGLEISSGMFQDSVAVQQRERRQPPVEFMVGSADQLPFPDQSFAVILAFFMLYHMSDIPKTLGEWSRVLNDGGKVLIATASALNKPKNKKLKQLVERVIGKTTAPYLSASFNLENGVEQLAGILKVVDTFIYEGKLKLTTAAPYLNAMNSVRDLYDPAPSDAQWDQAVQAVKAEVEKEIAEQGYFTDDVRRGFFIGEKI